MADEPQSDDETEDADEALASDAVDQAVEQGLAVELLHGAIPINDRPGERWAYPLWGMLLVSLFVAYHATALLVHNLPRKGLSKGLHDVFNKRLKLRRYFTATGNTQSWAMFAPNPHRSNIFMKVLVKDQAGQVWDMKHDIYQKRTYPYMFYDRMGKINRRIVDQKGYRRNYAAWVCREWERTHEGEAADEVQFVKMWTRIPPPEKLNAHPPLPVRLFMPELWSDWKPLMVGFDPNSLHLHQREEGIIRCASTSQGQLPNYLRRRYGLPENPDGVYRGLNMRTWWDVREAKRVGEQRRAERASDERERGGQSR